MTPSPEQRRAPALDEIARRIEQVAARNEQLLARVAAGEQRFRGLAKAVWKVQEEERRRLARELHDGIGQTLTALINQLRRVQQGGGTPGLEPAIDVAELALRDVRELSRLLRPPVLDDLGLRAGIAWLARTLGGEGALRIDVDWQAGEDSRFDPELETLVFRIAQEALNNVVKHAAAQRAGVTLRRLAGQLELEITDDGRGFDVARVLSPEGGAAGLGLRGMRDRVELFGGELSLSAEPGRGSRLRVAVPLEDRQP